MTKDVLQKYVEIPKSLIPYPENTDSSGQTGQMALISIAPALPCFLCNQPASAALITPAPEQFSGASMPWLTFPICAACEERQVKSQMTDIQE